MSDDVVALPRAGLRDRVLFLRTVDSLEGLDDQGLALLAEHAVPRAYGKGDVLTAEGEPPVALIFVVDGRVATTRKGAAGPFVGRGEGLGMVAVMGEMTSDLAIAAEDTNTLEIPVAAFRVVLEESFSLLRHALRVMGATLSRARNHLPADPDAPLPEKGTYIEKTRTLIELLIEIRRGAWAFMNIDALVDVARAMKEIRVPAGHVFWKVGETSTYVLHVVYGHIRCTSADGRSAVVGFDFTLGVNDVWSGEARPYEARAETDMIAYRIDYEDFIVICEMHATVGLDMLRIIARDYLASGKTNLE